MPEKYEPTVGDLKKAEDNMDDRQKELTNTREEGYNLRHVEEIKDWIEECIERGNPIVYTPEDELVVFDGTQELGPGQITVKDSQHNLTLVLSGFSAVIYEYMASKHPEIPFNFGEYSVGGGFCIHTETRSL